MTANHDTSEAVEAMTLGVERTFYSDAAGMLRRLHQRAVDAERERDEAHGYLSRLLTTLHTQCEPLPDLMGLCTQIDNAMTEIVALRASVATARADALREAAATRAQTDTSFEMYCAILALIKQPSTTGET